MSDDTKLSTLTLTADMSSRRERRTDRPWTKLEKFTCNPRRHWLPFVEIHLLVTFYLVLEGESHETYQELVLWGLTAPQNV